MKTTSLLAAALAFGAATATAAKDAPAPPRKILESSGALFGVREAVQTIDLSPSGKRIVYVGPGPGRVSTAWVADLAGGKPTIVTQTSGAPEHLDWCGFVSETRLICSASAMMETPEGIMIGLNRLIAVDDHGGNVTALGQEAKYNVMTQSDVDVLDWLPDATGAVLLQRWYSPGAKMAGMPNRHEGGLGIDRLDIDAMKFTRVEKPVYDIGNFITDGHGTVRITGAARTRRASNQLSTKSVYRYRKAGSTEWLPFSEWDDGKGMYPLAVDRDSNSAYVIRQLDGRDAVYRVKLDGALVPELVFKHDRVDVDDVVRLGRSGRVIGVTYAEEKRHVEFFDPEYRRLSAALRKSLPGQPQVEFLGTSTDGNTLLVWSGSDSDPGRYYVFDKVNKALNEIMLARPQLESVPLAKVKPVTYPAADGTPIPGYLTLPPGREDARGLPAVVLPHGGPASRDEWGFDWLSQFLAHEGFAVLQPNYRGSAGFGEKWMVGNGFKGWRTSIGDVDDAGKWLVAQGIADPARLSIVGWSYGGYAALQSGVLEPGLYKAIVAIAPVTDLKRVKNDARDYTNYDNTVEMIGKGPHLEEGSPVRNAAKIVVPVLLFHGTRDANVEVEHSEKMDKALRAAGRSSELVTFEGLEHSLDDSNVRAHMLDRIAAFLKGAAAK